MKKKKSKKLFINSEQVNETAIEDIIAEFEDNYVIIIVEGDVRSAIKEI